MISYFSFKMQNNCVTLQAEIITPTDQKNAKYAKNEWFKVRHTLCVEPNLKLKHFFIFYFIVLFYTKLTLTLKFTHGPQPHIFIHDKLKASVQSLTTFHVSDVKLSNQSCIVKLESFDRIMLNRYRS